MGAPPWGISREGPCLANRKCRVREAELAIMGFPSIRLGFLLIFSLCEFFYCNFISPNKIIVVTDTVHKAGMNHNCYQNSPVPQHIDKICRGRLPPPTPSPHPPHSICFPLYRFLSFSISFCLCVSVSFSVFPLLSLSLFCLCLSFSFFVSLTPAPPKLFPMSAEFKFSPYFLFLRILPHR